MESTTVNKEALVGLLEKIDQKKKELKQLRKDWQNAFSVIESCWKEDISTRYPHLKPCNIGEYVGVDITIKGRVYNVFIAKSSQKLLCWFGLDRKDRRNFAGDDFKYIKIKDVMENEDFDKLRQVVGPFSKLYKKTMYSDLLGYYIWFRLDQYDDAYQVFTELLRTFVDNYPNNDEQQ